MLIDWFTAAAQAVNFLVLVWLLKRFLYRPVLDAIDARERRIADRLRAAEEQAAEARRLGEDFRRRGESLERERVALLDQAGAQAEAQRRRLIDEARREAAGLRARLEEGLRNERGELLAAVSANVQREVFAIARKALADLASADLEQRIAEAFVVRLRGLDGEPRQQLAAAFGASSRPAVVQSAFELPAAQRSAIEEALRENLGVGGGLRFETVPELVGGIELATDGHKLSWNLADYLAALEDSVSQAFERKLPAASPAAGGAGCPLRACAATSSAPSPRSAAPARPSRRAWACARWAGSRPYRPASPRSAGCPAWVSKSW